MQTATSAVPVSASSERRADGGVLTQGEEKSKTLRRAPRHQSSPLRVLLSVLSVLFLAPLTSYAQAKYPFDLPAQPLAESLRAVGHQTSTNVMFEPRLVKGLDAPALRTETTPTEAIRLLLAGTKLTALQTAASTVLIQRVSTSEKSAATSQAVAPTGTNGYTHLAQAETNPSTQRVSSESRNSDNSPRASAEAEKNRIALEEIVVTGTHLRGRSGSLASPIISISREQFIAEGNASVQDVLEDLTVNFNQMNATNALTGVPGANNPTVNNPTGASAPNIHGLGSSATLSLLNNQRLPGAGKGYSVDVSMIPLLAIERIDVLSDGASPIYGTDAIGGVVNLVTRRKQSVLETSLRSSVPEHGGTEGLQFGQAIGRTWNEGSGFLAYQLDDQNDLKYLERRATANRVLRGPDTLPKRRQHALYGNIFQNLTSDVELGLEASYSEQSNDLQNRGITRTSFEFDGRQRFVTGQISSRFFGEWRLNASAHYADSRLETRVERVTPSPQITFGEDEGEEKGIGFVFDGTLVQLPAGPIGLAIGSDFRNESHTRMSTSQVSLDREVYAAFAEANIPLLDTERSTLDLSLAVRHDHYSDFGGTTNPRVGLIWGAMPGVHIRGTYSRSFRAPLLVQLDSSNLGVFAFPVSAVGLTDPLNPGGDSLVINAFDGAAPNLGPETSRNITFGVDLQPAGMPSLKVQLTAFDIEFKDRLATRDQAVLDVFAFGNPDTESVIERNPSAETISALLDQAAFFDDLTGGAGPGDFDIFIDLRQTNLASTSLRGLDASGRWAHDLPLGTLTLSGSLTYFDEFRNAFLPGTEGQDFKGNVYFPANYRARAGASFRKGPLLASLWANFVDGFEDRRRPVVVGVSSWTTCDLNINYHFDWLGGAGSMLQLNVVNLFDREPPFVIPPAPTSSASFDPSNANVLGRVFSAAFTHRW